MLAAKSREYHPREPGACPTFSKVVQYTVDRAITGTPAIVQLVYNQSTCNYIVDAYPAAIRVDFIR